MGTGMIKANLAELPSEVLDPILRYCKQGPGRTNVYWSLCLVSRGFRDLVLPILYNDVHVMSWRMLDMLMVSLQIDFPRRAGFQLNGGAGLGVHWGTDPDYLECKHSPAEFVTKKLQLGTIPSPTLTHLTIEVGIWRVPHSVFETLISALVKNPSSPLPQLRHLEAALVTQEWVRQLEGGVFTQRDKYIAWKPVDLGGGRGEVEADAHRVKSDSDDDDEEIYSDTGARSGSTCNCSTRSLEGIATLLRLRGECEDAGITFTVRRKGPWEPVKTWM